MTDAPIKPVCRNRRARFAYELLERFEAGLVLTGSEVKSMRAGRAHLGDAYACIRSGEAFLLKAHIDPYPEAGHFNHEPQRERKLLLGRREIRRLDGRLRERGYTLVPLSMYFLGSWAKVELALARGKRQVDKRQTIARRESDRRLQRMLKRRARPGPIRSGR
ncbi:MAG: SsrA-binding protein SmpB [Proteobacteria bacterium]|nr:SsrA-binding protein SmpB [Pseudomonadota bacterium]